MLGLLLVAELACAQPHLLLHDFFAGPKPTPMFIRENLGYLESLPFDGYVIYLRDPHWQTNVTGSVYAPNPMSFYDIMRVLTPVVNLPFRRAQHNFGLMFAGEGIDVFDDTAWALRIDNMRNLARALRMAGLKGLFFANENYADWARYGGKGCSRAYSLRVCQQQMQIRGRQVMEALTSEFADIVLSCTNGPWVSDYTFYERSGLNNIAHANELSGPFFVGLVDGKGRSAVVVDGGEFYSSRTISDFASRYKDQKFGLLSPEGVPGDSNSRAAGPNGFIPERLRGMWSSQVSAGAGVYDRETGMTARWMEAAIGNALSCVDDYVWVYTEGITFLMQPGEHAAAAPAEWREAVQRARAAERIQCRTQ